MHIALYRFCNLDPTLLQPLLEPLQSTFGVPVVLPPRPLPAPASGYSRARRQWLAGSFTQALAAEPGDQRTELRLGVTDTDLYAAGLNFVFGEASPRQRCAVFSVARWVEV